MSRAFVLMGGLLLASPALAAQRVHEVRLEHPAEGVFRFAPDRLVVGGGDVIEFTVQSGGPYVVAFVAADIPPALRGRLQAALPPGSTELRGPVLATAGASFRVALPGLPAGKYRFETVTHAAYRMQGTLTVR